MTKTSAADATQKMGTEKISKLLFTYSMPVYLSHVAGSIYNIISRAFIGNSAGPTGVFGLAALSVYFPFSMVQMAFAFLFGMGGSTFAAIKVGEGNKEIATRALNTSVQMITIVGLMMVVFGNLFLDKFLAFFGANAELLPYARDYGRIMLVGSVFQMTHIGITNYMRVEGKTGLAMIAVLISPLINIAASFYFVLYLKLGLVGAGYATILGQICSASFIIFHFIKNKGFFHLNRNLLKFDLKVTLEIMYMGMSSFAVQICQSFASTVLNVTTREYGGVLAQSGMGIVTTLQQFILQPAASISMGSQALIGYNYGSKKPDRVKELLKKGIITSTAIIIVEYIIMRMFNVELVSIFANKENSELIAFGSKALITYMFMLPLIPLQLQSASFFQSIRKPIHSMVISLLRQVIFLIPALLILPRLFGLDGVLYASPVSDFISFGITVPLYLHQISRLGKKENGERLAE